ncbi:hypothetical protein [Methylobacterium sp. CM6257]|jgi:hypothetical protein
MVPTMVAVTVMAVANPEGTIHRADTGTHCTADDPADRSSRAATAGCSFLSAAD